MVKEALIAIIVITLFVGVVFGPALAQQWNAPPEQEQVQPTEPPKGSHGVIAYSPTTGKIGKAVNYKTRAEAEKEALDRCGAPDCKAYTWFRNACGALARGNNGNLGWAWDVDRSEAERKAIEQCRSVSGQECQIIAWGCASP